MHESVRILQDLVRIPSVNPMGEDDPGPQEGEAAVADYVETWLLEAGVDVERQEVLPGRPNVIGRMARRPGAPTLVFEAHTDTVPTTNMRIEPFEPAVTDGKLYGRGACDTKASLAAMLVAFRCLAESRDRPDVNLVLAATIDEEYRFRGILHALENGLAADFAVCGEPTGLRVVVAHNGAVRWRIHTTGVSTHSSRCDEGVNAIYRMAKVICALEEFHETELRSRPAHRLVGSPSLNVGHVQGGQTVNTVPGSATIELERRVIPGETTETAHREVLDYLAAHPKIEFELDHETPFNCSGPMEISENEPIVKAAVDACAGTVGRAAPVGMRFGSDAARMARAGIRCLVLGPGDILKAHSPDECVETEQVEAAARIYEETARRLPDYLQARSASETADF